MWFRRIYNHAYPTYECENCIGMGEYGCQCAYYLAYAPGSGNIPAHVKALRRLINP